MRNLRGRDIIVWAKDNGYKIENKDPIEWAIDNNWKIDGKDAILWAKEKGCEIGGKDHIVRAIDNDRKDPAALEGFHVNRFKEEEQQKLQKTNSENFIS